MRVFKLEKGKNLQESIPALLNPTNDEVVRVFEVAALDHKPKNLTTPKLYLTKTKLLFTYDELIEVYNLSELEIEMRGNPPVFTLWQLLLLGKYNYSSEEDTRLMRQDENLTRLSLAETNAVSKEFVLRQADEIQEGFKTWAMGRMILDTKLGNTQNPVVEEIFEGYFSTFNQKTVMTFIGGFLGYFVLKVLALNFMPDIINTILDVILSIGLLFMAWWVYISIANKLKKYERVYLSYS